MHAIQNTTHAILFFIIPCIFFLCATTAGAQETAGTLFTLKQVGTNVWAAIEPNGQSNAGFVIGDDGVLVIDTFITADANGNLGTQAARQLLAEIRKLTKLPVRFVINTHYHLDHVGGNGIFVDAGATVLAQRNVRSWLHSETMKMIGAALKPEQQAFIEALPEPSIVFDQGLDVYLGSRAIQVVFWDTQVVTRWCLSRMRRSSSPAISFGATSCPTSSMRQQRLGSIRWTHSQRSCP